MEIILTIITAWVILWAVHCTSRNHAFGTFVTLLPCFFAPALLFLFTKEISLLRLGWFGNYYLMSIAVLSLLAAILLVLDTIGLLSLMTDLLGSIMNWFTGVGWTFSWG
jgi:hypothetical protein